MNGDELDPVYARLADALGRVGERDAALFLAMVALELIATAPDGTAASDAIERAERLTSI